MNPIDLSTLLLNSNADIVFVPSDESDRVVIGALGGHELGSPGSKYPRPLNTNDMDVGQPLNESLEETFINSGTVLHVEIVIVDTTNYDPVVAASVSGSESAPASVSESAPASESDELYDTENLLYLYSPRGAPISVEIESAPASESDYDSDAGDSNLEEIPLLPTRAVSICVEIDTADEEISVFSICSWIYHKYVLGLNYKPNEHFIGLFGTMCNSYESEGWEDSFVCSVNDLKESEFPKVLPSKMIVTREVRTIVTREVRMIEINE